MAEREVNASDMGEVAISGQKLLNDPLVSSGVFRFVWSDVLGKPRMTRISWGKVNAGRTQPGEGAAGRLLLSAGSRIVTTRDRA